MRPLELATSLLHNPVFNCKLVKAFLCYLGGTLDPYVPWFNVIENNDPRFSALKYTLRKTKQNPKKYSKTLGVLKFSLVFVVFAMFSCIFPLLI